MILTSALRWGFQADNAYSKCGLTKAEYSVLKDCVFQAWKAWRNRPKTAVALAAEWWQWVLHFRSLEKYTPRSFSLVICSKVSLESESADFMVNLVWGQKLLVLFLKPYINISVRWNSFANCMLRLSEDRCRLEVGRHHFHSWWCVVSEKLAVVFEVGWHVVDEQSKQEWS